MGSILSDRDTEYIRKLLAEGMVHPVRIVLVTQTLGCETCRDAETLLRELAETSDKLVPEQYNLAIDREKVIAEFAIDRVPVFALLGEQDYGIRYFGIPAGYEFRAFLDDILDLSRRTTGLSDQSKALLKGLARPVHIRVFVTPTCPYCPAMVRLAHQAALESERVRADSVEALEFPDLASRYAVMGVPKTILNDRFATEGAIPEDAFIDWLVKSANEESALKGGS